MSNIQPNDRVRAAISEGPEAGLPVHGWCELVNPEQGTLVVREEGDDRYTCSLQTATLEPK